MTDERLSEARKALTRYEDRNSKPNPAHLADAIRGLLALAEEALTPTDDERRWDEYRDGDPANNTPDQRRAFFAALRRTEVPEPSAEMIAPEDGMTLEELGDAMLDASPRWDGDEAMHSIVLRFLRHYAALDAEVYAAREVYGFEDDVEILFRYDDETQTLVRVAVEPQGEASDVLIDRAIDRFFETRGTHRLRMRAALRAAGGEGR